MPRTFWIVVLSVMTMLACKTDKPAKKEEAKVVEPRPSPARPPEPALPAATRDDPATPSADTGKNSEIEDKGIAMMGKVGDLFASGAGDCEKLATDLRNLVTANAELHAQLNAEMAKKSANERDAFMARNKAAYDAVMHKMTPALKACGGNKSFLAALRQFSRD